MIIPHLIINLLKSETTGDITCECGIINMAHMSLLCVCMTITLWYVFCNLCTWPLTTQN